MSSHRHSLWPGLILILLGALLLMRKLTPYSFGFYEIYPIVIMGIGVLLFVSVIGKRDKGAIFPGTILLLLGLFFFLRNYDLVPYRYVRDIWPMLLVILGIAFLAVFLTKPSDWGVLIPAATFLFFGIVLLLNRLDVFYLDVWDIIADYWPIALIVVGAGIILGSFKRHQTHLK